LVHSTGVFDARDVVLVGERRDGGILQRHS
jgi:hypothetical protein